MDKQRTKNISVVITTLNEEKYIAELLKSLIQQTQKPHEIIVVDAGSIDRTADIIKDFQKKEKDIKFYSKPGVNRSQGRNIAIKKAQGSIIAVTDAGCIPKEDWLYQLSKPFANNAIDVVAGYYKPWGESTLQKCAAVFTCVLPHQFNAKTFIPASRSIAFRKNILKKIGGYPEELNTCEDLVLVQKLKKQQALFATAKHAIVYWKQSESLKEFFRQLHNYAKGDVEARYFPHIKRIILIWIRYILASVILFTFPLLLLFLLPQYLAWIIGKGYFHVRNKKAFILLPLLQLTADLAVLSGSFLGFVTNIINAFR